MSATERRKGASGELEVIQLLKDRGWLQARRTSDGRVQTARGDVANGPAGTHIECKRSEKTKIWEWMDQAESECGLNTPVVVFRRSRSEWMACLPFDELLALLQLRES